MIRVTQILVLLLMAALPSSLFAQLTCTDLWQSPHPPGQLPTMTRFIGMGSIAGNVTVYIEIAQNEVGTKYVVEVQHFPDGSWTRWELPLNEGLASANDLCPGVFNSGTGSASNTLAIRPHATGTSPLTGQASQQILLEDMNGDGTPDIVALTTGGVEVQLLAADNSMISAKTFPLGFSPSSSNIIAADFNRDGKIDIAVSDSS